MRLAFFDVETSGLRPGADILQISVIVVNPHENTIVKVINEYCHTDTQIPLDAIAIHGLTNKFVTSMSGGKTFEDVVAENQETFYAKNMVWIAHNVSFDKNMINRALENHGMFPIDFGTKTNKIILSDTGINYNLCTMYSMKDIVKYKAPRMKLETMYNTYASRDQYRTQLAYKRFCSTMGVHFDENRMFHNALFDTFLLLLIYNDFKDKLTL